MPTGSIFNWFDMSKEEKEERNKMDYFTIINLIKIDGECKRTSSGEFQKVDIIAAVGCNGIEHAVEITEEYYVDNEIVHARIISNSRIGKCTCKKDKNYGFFGIEREGEK